MGHLLALVAGWERRRGPRYLSLADALADAIAEEALAEADGTPTPDMPTALMQVALSELEGGGTQMVTTVAWAGDDGWKWMLATGTDAGMTAAAGQIDELLKENP